MSTPEEQLRQALGLPPTQTQPAPLPIAGTTPPATGGYDVYKALGIRNPNEPEEEEDAGIFSSFLAGLGSGFTEPLTAVPYIRERMDFLDGMRGDDLRDKVSYGLGWLAGGFVPGGVAFKIGGAGARALKLAKGAEKAGEAMVELTRAGKLVRGGIAGAAWSAGQEAEGMEDWAKNVAVNAAMFGVGDLVIDSGVRALAKWYRTARGGPPSKELVDAAIATNTTGLDEQQSVIMGRALSIIDDIVEREIGDIATMEALPSRRLNLQLGIEQLGLEEVQSGAMKIIPSVGGDVKDIGRIIDGLGDFSHTTITRTGREGRPVTDILVGRKSDFDPRIAREFQENGWVEGMEVIWKGKKRIVTSGTKNPDILMGFSADNPGSRLHPIRRSEMHILPIVHTGDQRIPNASKWWADFVNEYGAFPEDNFVRAFKEFTDNHAIGGITRERLRGYFVTRQLSMIKSIDPELANALETVGRGSADTLKKIHPEGSFNALASEKGFLPEWAPRESGDGWDIVLRNQKNGTSSRHSSRESAEAFLQNYMLDPGEMMPDMPSPIGMGALSISDGGVGVMPSHSALEASNFTTPLLFTATSRVLPRESFIRRGEDLLRKAGIDRVRYRTPQGEEKFVGVNLWSGEGGVGGFQHIREGQIRVRNELFGKYAPEGTPLRDWMGDLIKMRGGKRDLKTIRTEVLDKWWDIFDRPVAEWGDRAKKAGLSSRETELLQEGRQYLNDLMKRIMPHVDVDNPITGDEFREQFLPFFRRMSSSRWGKALNDSLTKQGKKGNKAIEDLLDDAYNQGMIGKHERDPFTVMARLTDYGLKKVHVERHYNATTSMLNKMAAGLKQLPEGESRRSMDLLHRSMSEYMNLTRGGAPEVHRALNVATKDFFDRLDIKISDVAFDRMINTMVSLNYGAFMGFRLGQPLRNLSQTVFTVLPRVGSSNLARGIEATFRNPREAMKEVFGSGAIVERGFGLAMDDVVLTRQIQTIAKGGGMTEKALAAGARLEDLSNFSLGGTIKIGNTEVPIGLFNASDQWQRVVAYMAQKHKTIKAINSWKTKNWTVEKFNQQAGLNQFGETVATEFHRRMAVNQDDAIKFVSTLLSDDTHFMYQLGAGPAWMAQGIGRVFGQYGTWPAWYAENLAKGLTQGSKADRIQYAGWFAAAHAAIIGTTYATGINLSRWTGLSSFGWAGGPAFDVGTDIAAVWGGLQQSGEPTASRQMVLGSYGLEDKGPSGSIMGSALGSLPGGLHQIGLKESRNVTKGQSLYKLWENTWGMFTPGVYAFRDARKVAEALQDNDAGEAVIQAFGLRRHEATGNTYPEINFTK